jgi:hypothetical protein
MGLPRFFRLAKPRQFHYEPIYYDERKEKMQERIRRVEQKMGIKVDDGQLKRTIERGSISSRHLGRKKTSRQSTLRLIIIFIFLLLISYLLFFF